MALTEAEQKITASKEVGLVIWRSHIEGAMGIVRSRGEEMVQNKYSMKLFIAVRLQIVCVLGPIHLETLTTDRSFRR